MHADAKRCHGIGGPKFGIVWHRSAEGQISVVFPEIFKSLVGSPFLPANSAHGSRSPSTTESETSSLLKTIGWFLIL